VVALEAGSAAAFAPLARVAGLSVRYHLADVALKHTGIAGARQFEAPGDDVLDDADVLALSMTGAEAECDLIEKARARGLPTVQLLDTWGPYRHRVREPMADRVAVVDMAARAEAIAAGVAERRIGIVGQPAWEQVTALPEADATTVAFLSQPIARHYGTSLGYTEASALAMLDEVAAVRPDYVKRVLVVPHPAGDLTTGDERAMPLAQALAEAGTVVGMFSSAMADALIGGRRVVSLQPGAVGEDRSPLSRHGRIRRVTTAAEMVSALGFPNVRGSDLAAVMAGSTERLAALLREVAAR
jgi:hypothetical protein